MLRGSHPLPAATPWADGIVATRRERWQVAWTRSTGTGMYMPSTWGFRAPDSRKMPSAAALRRFLPAGRSPGS